MRKLSAQYILAGTGEVLRRGIITVNEEGIITEIIDTGGNIIEQASVEFYNGILIPGFINCHCHLELSHLRGKFPESLKLSEFLNRIVKERGADEKEIAAAAAKADKEMWKNGISAVGDISNLPITFDIKSSSKIYYHTFIESLGFSPERADRAFAESESCLKQARIRGLSSSVVPHSPYSISKPLFVKISELAQREKSVLSMHNQESSHEDEFYRNGNGPIPKHLKENLGIDASSFVPTGKSALASVLHYFPYENNLLLVHNTCTGEADLEIIKQSRSTENTWFTLCPNSNLYIEEKLPDVYLFMRNNLRICLGTDGLCSNRQLSILEEIKTLQYHFPQVALKDMITWGTKNGAEALKIDRHSGTIAKGKSPGINLLYEMDLQHLKLLPDSKIKRLV